MRASCASQFVEPVLWCDPVCSEALRRLLLAFPPDKLDADGRLYWSGFRRLPTPRDLNLADPQHLEFLTSAANIIAFSVGLHESPEVPLGHPWRSPDLIKSVRPLWHGWLECLVNPVLFPARVVRL